MGSSPGCCPVLSQITAIKKLRQSKNPLRFSISGPGLCRDKRVGGNLPQTLLPCPCSQGEETAQPSPAPELKERQLKQQQSAHKQNGKKGTYRHGILMGQHRWTGTNERWGKHITVAGAGPSPLPGCASGPLPMARALFQLGIRNPGINRNKSGLVGCSPLIMSRCKKKIEMNDSVM